MRKSKMSKKSALKKNFLTVILLALAGSIIYGLPYYRFYYYDSYMQLYHLSNVQIGMLGSAYGFLGMLSYLLGGVMADKFNAKKMVVFSLIATGACGFLHLLTGQFYVLLAIYVIWGLTSLLTFWPACVKMVRMQGNASEQSRTYGIFEGTRGAFNAGHLAIATAIFAVFQAKSMPAMGIHGGLIFYSVTPIILGILFIFILKDPAKMEADEENKDAKPQKKFEWSDVIKILKLPAVWMVVVMVFTSYTFNMSTTYFNPYATNILGTTAVVAAVITTSTQYIRPFSTIFAGFLADKFGKSTFMAIGYIMMMIGLGLVMFAGQLSGTTMGVVMIAGIVIMYIGMYFCFGLTFSFLEEGGVPMELSGTATGVICTLGYLPEVIDSLIAGKILDTYKGIGGYYIYFVFMLAMAVIGLIFAVMWGKTYGKRYKEQQAAKE